MIDSNYSDTCHIAMRYCLFKFPSDANFSVGSGVQNILNEDVSDIDAIYYNILDYCKQWFLSRVSILSQHEILELSILNSWRPNPPLNPVAVEACLFDYRMEMLPVGERSVKALARLVRLRPVGGVKTIALYAPTTDIVF
jgi:hypothetical protein